MPTPITTFGDTVWNLPPLILHPFSERVPAASLLENSRAALMLSGLLPSDGTDPEELNRRVLSGRYAEIRMLFFVGKDVCRWLDQCLDWAQHQSQLRELDVRRQSFAGLLIANAPDAVREKLMRWGVADYISIFSRAIGLNALFTQPPAFDHLSEDFLRNYHRYGDFLYRCYMESEPHRLIASRNFRFELYASGEYSRILETEWESN